jgi:tetratricopeptide (TPR) repeat protein
MIRIPFEDVSIMSVIYLNLLSSNDREIELSFETASEVRMEEFTVDDDHSSRMLQDAMDKDSLNYWLWHDLCRLYAATNNLDGAIHACELEIKKSGDNPSPLMELTNLYAAKGDYKAAIKAEMSLLKIKSVILLLALKESKNPVTMHTSGDKLKRKLEW